MYANGFATFDWTILNEFHFPVIIKPIDEAHGNGVCMNITTILNYKKT